MKFLIVEPSPLPILIPLGSNVKQLAFKIFNFATRFKDAASSIPHEEHIR